MYYEPEVMSFSILHINVVIFVIKQYNYFPLFTINTQHLSLTYNAYTSRILKYMQKINVFDQREFCFLSITLLNGEVCKHYFAIGVCKFPLLVTRRRHTTATSSKRPRINWLTLTLLRSSGHPLLPPPRLGLQRCRQWGHDHMFPRVPTHTTLTTDSAVWERSLGDLPRHHTVHGPWLQPAKMDLSLSREWISTTEYID